MICSIYYATWGGVGGSVHLHETDGLIFSSIPSPCEVREFLIKLGLESLCFLVNSPVEDPPEVELPGEEHRCEEVAPAYQYEDLAPVLIPPMMPMLWQWILCFLFLGITE